MCDRIESNLTQALEPLRIVIVYDIILLRCVMYITMGHHIMLEYTVIHDRMMQ